MRIIAGLAKGIRLSAPEGRGVRPTEDRVKESIFSTLGDLQGATVLDLFSGSGALGLEALSRGAARVIFIEQNRRHLSFIHQNHAAVAKSIGETAGECEFICADARRASQLLGHLRGIIGVVLADPPYETPPHGYGSQQLLDDRELAALLAPGCLLALEHSAATHLAWHPLNPWELIKEKTYGIRAVSFARIASETQQE